MRDRTQQYPDYTEEISILDTTGVTPEILTKIIEKHMGNASYNRQLYDRYRCLDGCVPIFNRQAKYDDAESEPINNRVNNDFFSEIIDFKTGYFAGKPINYSYSRTTESEGMTGGDEEVEGANKALTDFTTRNNMHDLDMEMTKFAAICGYAGRLFYIDVEGNERAKIIPPYEVIVLSRNEITEPKYAIRYYPVKTSRDEKYIVEFYDDTTVYYFEGVLNRFTSTKKEQHGYDLCPLQGIPNNREMLGDAEKVLSIIDDYDKVVSDNSNEVEAFVHAIMAIENITMQDEDIKRMQKTGALQYYSGANQGRIYYVTKEINDAFTEHHLERAKNNIYRFSKTPNLSDETFGTASGESLKFKLTGHEAKCGMFQAKVTSAGVYMFKLLAKSWAKRYIEVDPLQCIMDYKRNFPLNLTAEAQAITALISAGLPKEVAFAQLSFIDDVQYVMDLIEQEIEGIPSLMNEEGEEGEEE